jgi:hypothetical protein
MALCGTPRGCRAPGTARGFPGICQGELEAAAAVRTGCRCRMRDQPARAAAAIRDNLRPPDPGSRRRSAAVRATPAGLLTFLLVLLPGAATPVPSAHRILGFAVGLFTGALARDASGRQHARRSSTARRCLQRHTLASTRCGTRARRDARRLLPHAGEMTETTMALSFVVGNNARPPYVRRPRHRP